MKRVYSAAQMRALDGLASESHGVPVAVLMENAGSALADEALSRAEPRGRFFFLCGTGHNGGDGFVAARKLAVAGRSVHVELVGVVDQLKGEPLRNFRALAAVGSNVRVERISSAHDVGTGDVVIDALLGTGLNRAPSDAYADAITRIVQWRQGGACVVAADVPSGLHSDTGVPFDPCVHADVTVSFAAAKVGQVVEPGLSTCGELVIADIGIPPQAFDAVPGESTWVVEESDASSRVPDRDPSSHKGTYGHLLIVAGSRGKTGAAALAGMSAYRSGAGLVSVAARPDALPHVLVHATELMGVELEGPAMLGPRDLEQLAAALEGKKAAVFGPGLARGDETPRLFRELLARTSIPSVLDADALNAVAADVDLLKRAGGPIIVTPHPGEMARLMGVTTAEVQANRVAAARNLAARTGAIVVLKGARTLIALEDGTVFVNPTGNAGMATGGTGDVLAGVIGALLAQGLAPVDAAIVGVFAHGLAGDIAVLRTGLMGLTATDVLMTLGTVWSRWKR